MNEFVVVAAGIAAVALIVIAVIALIVFALTRHSTFYKNFKKPVKTMGVVDDVEYVSSPHHEEDHYIIRYSYADNSGTRRTAQFIWQRRIYEAGDKIALHFDSQSPDNSIADCQLNYGKSVWWKVVLILAAIFIPAAVIAVWYVK